MEDRKSAKLMKQGVLVLCGVLLCLVLMNLTEFFAIFKRLTAVASPIIFGMVFAFFLSPIVNLVDKILPRLLEKKGKKSPAVRKISRAVGIVIALAVGGFVVYGFFYLILPELYESLMKIVNNFSAYFAKMEDWLRGILDDNPQLREMALNSLHTLYDRLDTLLDPNGVVFSNLQKIMTGLTSSVVSVVNGIVDMVVGIVASVYILWSKDIFFAQAKKVLVATCAPKRAEKLLHTARETHRIFGGFITGQLIDSLIVGIVCYIGLLILRMPYALLIATVVGVTNIIPFFGPFIGAIPSAFLILMVDPLKCFYFILFILVLQQIEGNIIAPRVLGDSVGISGFWVLVSITVAGKIFGFAGMLLGVPVFAVLYTVFKEWLQETLQKKKTSRRYQYLSPLARIVRPTHSRSGRPEPTGV
ncbi:MAG: AI-2E family transporter [Oscillospiraceae bacterium]|nr:AI-2E family transporter [Oscillospiraceae bacterium]